MAMTLCTRCWTSLNAHGDLFILNNRRGRFECFTEMPSCDSNLPEQGLIGYSHARISAVGKCLQLDLLELQISYWLSTDFL